MQTKLVFQLNAVGSGKCAKSRRLNVVSSLDILT